MLLRSPLHDRHAALGAKFAEFGGWEMPLEYAGGGVIKEHTAVRTAVGVFDVSHLGKAGVVGAGRGRLRQLVPQQRPGPHRPRPGAVHAVLRRRHRRRGGRPDRVPVLPTTTSSWCRTRRTPPRWSAGWPRRRRTGVTVTDEHRTYAILAVQGPQSAETLAELGLPTDLDYMSFHAIRRRSWSAAPATPASTATSWSSRGTRRAPVWDALIDGRRAALRPRRARHAAHRDGLPAARPGPLPGHHPGAGPLRLGGGLVQAGLLGPRGAAQGEGRRSAAHTPRTGAHRPRHPPGAHAGVRRASKRSARPPAAPSRRRRRSASRSRCSTPRPAWPRATWSRWTSAAAAHEATVVKPPFVQPSVR